MSITVNLRYTGKKGAAQAFPREMISSGTVEKIRAEKGNLRYEYYLPFSEAADNETLFYHAFFSFEESCCFFRSSTIFTNHSTIAGS